MSIKFASWNVEGRLNGYAEGSRGTPEHILRGIEALDADVLVLPEAYLNNVDDGVDARLHALGYETILTIPYDDYGREDEVYMQGALHIRLLSKLTITQVEYVRWGDVRNLITCTVVEPETGRKLRIIATHLDDRSESSRLVQVGEAIPFINASNLPTIMSGDFNAMWHRGGAVVLDSKPARFVGRHIPHKGLRSVVTRLSDMAIGSVLSKITSETNLREADLTYRPTTTPKMRGMLGMPSIPLVQIDHMLVSPDITVSNYAVGVDGGSDHRSISAMLTLR